LGFKKYDFDPPFFGGPRDYERGTDHFLNLHLENPEAFRYYTAQFAVVSQLVGQYPIFHRFPRPGLDKLTPALQKRCVG
jgi:hypothetical protein